MGPATADKSVWQIRQRTHQYGQMSKKKLTQKNMLEEFLEQNVSDTPEDADSALRCPRRTLSIHPRPILISQAS